MHFSTGGTCLAFSGSVSLASCLDSKFRKREWSHFDWSFLFTYLLGHFYKEKFLIRGVTHLICIGKEGQAEALVFIFNSFQHVYPLTSSKGNNWCLLVFVLLWVLDLNIFDVLVGSHLYACSNCGLLDQCGPEPLWVGSHPDRIPCIFGCLFAFWYELQVHLVHPLPKHAISHFFKTPLAFSEKWCFKTIIWAQGCLLILNWSLLLRLLVDKARSF